MTDTPQWRPRLHFTPARHWTNDPNGLIWHQGEWHLFFQHNPQGDTWGHMSWGHAVSHDLLHWEELPLAIAEDAQWMIFSGSVVVDEHDTAGFGAGAMVACYTGHAQAGGRQVQMLAHSLDRGRTWTKFPGNPVLDVQEAHFRDPKVFRHGNRWVMLVSMAEAGELRFYESPDLQAWSWLSSFRLSLPGCRLWECPDLLRLRIAGEPGDDATRWLLKWDVYEGHPGGGSGALGVVGRFDGRTFTAEQAPQWLDGGMDFYAAIAFGATPPGDARVLLMGWMNDHHYAAQTPTAPWRGAMSLPRELALARTAQGLVVTQQPLAELAAWRGAPVHVAPCDVADTPLDLFAPGRLPVAHEIRLRVAPQRPGTWTLALRAGRGEATVLSVDTVHGRLMLDRRHAGVAPAVGGFAGCREMAWPGACATDAGLRIVVDACSVEVFTDDGQATLTELVFPQAGSTGIRLWADAPMRLTECVAWPLARPGC